MPKLKVGVIGVGVLGRHHARLYAGLPDVELVGVCDLDAASAQQVALEHQARAFATVDELAAAAEALSVAVPTDGHHAVVLRLLEQGRHVLVEKPLAATPAEGAALVAVANQRHLVLHCGHVERYNPVIAYLETKLDRPRFIEAHRLAAYPPPRPGRAPRGTEVGVVLDLMIHDLDIILALVRSYVTRVDAVGIPVLSRTEDLANARLAFANGCVANVTASRVSPELMRKIRVFQNNAYLSLDYGEKKGEIHTLGPAGIVREPVPIHDQNALELELADFVRCVLAARDTGVVPECRTSAHNGLKALEIAGEIVRQITAQNAI